MGVFKSETLSSITGRDEFIIAEALATALIALEQLPEARQPTRNMADMRMLLNSLYPPPEVSLHLTTARWRFIPSARPFGA
jgi:hypothetical protein